MSAWGLGSPYGERFWFFVVRARIFIALVAEGVNLVMKASTIASPPPNFSTQIVRRFHIKRFTMRKGDAINLNNNVANKQQLAITIASFM